MGFKKAERRQRFLRMALYGPSSSGKTYTALTVARGLVGEEGTIALIDTERSSASIYDKFGFDMQSLRHYSHTDYIAMIEEAAAAQYDVLIIDSVSHAYDSEGGLLSVVDDQQTSKNMDSFRAWGSRAVKEAQQKLWAAILDYPGHVIVTMRSKTEYSMDKNAKGKTEVKKIGLAPIQRAGVEYEFDIVGRLDIEHNMMVDKARDPEGKLEGKVIRKPGKEFVAELAAWLGKGSTPLADYKARITATCQDVADAMDSSLESVKAIVWGWLRGEDANFRLEDLSTIELENLPDKIWAEFGPGDEEEQRQLRVTNHEEKISE